MWRQLAIVYVLYHNNILQHSILAVAYILCYNNIFQHSILAIAYVLCYNNIYFNKLLLELKKNRYFCFVKIQQLQENIRNYCLTLLVLMLQAERL